MNETLILLSYCIFNRLHNWTFFAKVIIIFQNDLMYAVPGGLIGVGTKIDPTLCRADRMVGQVLGSVGGLPDIFTELEVSYYLVTLVSVYLCFN